MKNRAKIIFTTIVVSVLTTTITVGQGRFSVAATVTPGFHNLDFSLGDVNLASGSQSYRGLSLGLIAYYAFTPKWSLSAGLLHTRFSGDSRFENASGVTTYSRQLQSFQVPVLLNFTPSSHRLSPYLSAGLLTNYNYRITANGTQTNQKIDAPNALTTYAMIGIGAHYRITPRLALIVQPTAAYRLNKPSSGYPLNYTRFNDYLFGLQTQLKFTF
ncbi:outer membrane beta-barrel protein [Spirosoma luteum]|uniref:outer membrane beta-barrel protein n=1 Tax=Spirosoma luteum TaxID=431553 RepID=UPI000378FDD5|nr:outer membrane beta-barrel protein [Spirosoma luteum]